MMPFPTTDRLPILAQYLDDHFFGKYMVWNLSEHSYETDAFGDQVIDVLNLGYPCPTMEQVLVTCNSIKAWLDSEHENIAVMHCQASKCRSIMMLAIYLYWY
jgi:hypothetical protein